MRAGGVGMVFAAHTKKVAFVVAVDISLFIAKNKAIVKFSVFGYNEAAAHGALFGGGLRLQPLQRLALKGFGAGGGVHREAGGKHFGQDDYIGFLYCL